MRNIHRHSEDRVRVILVHDRRALRARLSSARHRRGRTLPGHEAPPRHDLCRDPLRRLRFGIHGPAVGPRIHSAAHVGGHGTDARSCRRHAVGGGGHACRVSGAGLTVRNGRAGFTVHTGRNGHTGRTSLAGRFGHVVAFELHRAGFESVARFESAFASGLCGGDAGSRRRAAVAPAGTRRRSFGSRGPYAHRGWQRRGCVPLRRPVRR